jgi:hypothetical protein
VQAHHNASFLSRFTIYQRERFPLIPHGLLVAVISLAGVNFSALARNFVAHSALRTPYSAFIVAFLCALGFFLQLRVADEFKDYADDLAHRPYRPVPRGLIQLRELATLAFSVMGMQIGLAVWLHPGLWLPLLGVWSYMGLMRYEFFAPDWLKSHPVIYLLSHMGIMPLIFGFITACDWLVAGAMPPPGLGWFLALGFMNGMVFELGRKIRAPQDEEPGVETYSLLWGRGPAVRSWLLALLLAAFCAGFAARAIAWGWVITRLSLVLLAMALWIGWRFLLQPSAHRAKWIETFSGLWTAALYLGLGVAPVFFT